MFGLHFGDIVFNGLLNACRTLHKILGEFGWLAVNAEHIVQHQHLAGAIDTRADADGGDGDGGGDFARQFSWNALQQQHADPGIHEGGGVLF